MLNLLPRPPLIAARGAPSRSANARFAPPPLTGAGRGVSTPTAPVTSYANPGGTGDRQALVSLTLTATALDSLSSGAGKLFDGNLTASSVGSIEPLGTVNAGEGLRIDWGARKYIDEMTMTYGLAPNNGAWIWRVSNDLANFTQVASITWDQASQIVPLTGLDFGGYRFYEFICPAGHTVTNDWFIEITCKIANGN